jgi:hypothetical protein
MRAHSLILIDLPASLCRHCSSRKLESEPHNRVLLSLEVEAPSCLEVIL